MKRKSCFIISLLMMLVIINLSYIPIVKAADEYDFELNYTGSVVINETKDANVVLRGTDATTYPRVQIKVDVTGPATPKVLATDSSGVEHDIIELGYWGPETGFAVGGTFENITPVKATFPAAGTYTITLTLLNLDANSAVITTKTETIEVLEDASNITNEIANEEPNNTVEELPQTGTSITEYVIYGGIILTAVTFGYYKMKKIKV